MLEDTADFRFTGEDEFDLFGDNLLVTDWNVDGIDDVWISAPFAEFDDMDDFELDDEGIVSLFPGVDARVVLGGFRPNEVRYPTGATVAVVGPQDDRDNEALFGGSMAVGDLLGCDGVTELAIGSSLFDTADGDRETGLVSILTRENLAGSTPESPRDLEFFPEAVRIEGIEDSERFGFRIKAADLLPDPGDELIVGAPLGDGRRNTSGVVYVFNPKALAFPVSATATPTHFATATPRPTLTRTAAPSATVTGTAPPVPTPTASGTPEGTSEFDLRKDGVLDSFDLFELSRQWQDPAKRNPPFDGDVLVRMLREMKAESSGGG